MKTITIISYQLKKQSQQIFFSSTKKWICPLILILVTKSTKNVFYCYYLVFCPQAGSLCLVYSRRVSYLLNTNKARAHLYGRAPDSFQTDNSYIVGIELGISRTEVQVLTTELRRLSIKVEL